MRADDSAGGLRVRERAYRPAWLQRKCPGMRRVLRICEGERKRDQSMERLYELILGENGIERAINSFIWGAPAMILIMGVAYMWEFATASRSLHTSSTS